MKILAVFFPISDMGGIINHHEQLCAGLQELGHTVDTRLLVWKSHAPRSVAGGKGTVGYSGLEFDQRRGFTFREGSIIPYRGKSNLSKWKEFAAGYDLIIWQVAVPTKQAENRGNTDWIQLYDVPVKQIAMIHDGNFLDSYPWLWMVGQHLTALACVHHCALNSAANIDVPSALVLNPQEICMDHTHRMVTKESFIRRRKGFLSLQTFKAWKHVPELVAAVPHMEGLSAKLLAGKGIDYYYLTSKDKCKYPGIWQEALAHGMQYLDVITNHERDHLLGTVTALIDPSWSRKYARIGGHFNRVLVDAIKQGTLPIARNLGISTNAAGIGELFVDGENCLCIPWDATPGEFAHLASEYCNLGYPEYRKLMESAIRLLPEFDRKSVAQRIVDMACHRLTMSTGLLSSEVKLKGYEALLEFFNEQRSA